MNFLASAASGHGRRAGEKIFGMDVQRFGQRCSGRQGEGADVVVRFFVGKNTFGSMPERAETDLRVLPDLWRISAMGLRARPPVDDSSSGVSAGPRKRRTGRYRS